MKKKVSKEKLPIFLLLVALFLATASLLQMRYYYLTFLPPGVSDLVGFYITRFADGISHWPYETYTLLTNGNSVGPIEYPFLSGLIVWLTTFVTPKGSEARINYFFTNSAFLIVLFLVTVFLVSKLTDRKFARLLIISPAVLMSLYLNWDLWAVVPMLFSIYFFEKESLRISGIFLGVAIATKFFPIVLIFPAVIYLWRIRKRKRIIEFLSFTILTWLLINLPVAILNTKGWLYFYEFSASRILGDGSFFNIFAKFKLISELPMWSYYFLNILIFLGLGMFLFKVKEPVSLGFSAFLGVLAFTYFGKQYSMQYVLWLTPLAIVSLSKLPRKRQNLAIRFYLLWQLGEFLLHVAYFKNMQKGMLDSTYAIFASFRYLATAIFAYVLIKQFVTPLTQSKRQ